MHHVQPFVRKSKQDRDLDESQKKEIATVFSYYDSDAKGYLTKLEYEMAFVVLFGYKPCKYETRNLLSDVYRERCSKSQDITEAQSQDWKISKDRFQRMRRVDKFERIKSSFQAIDTDGKGFITWTDFIRATEQLDINAPESTLKACFIKLATLGQDHESCASEADLHVTQRQFSLLWSDRVSHIANEERKRLLSLHSHKL